MYLDRKLRRDSALVFILKALIPYTEENIMLAFKPNLFFNELEKISRYKRQTLEKALREAERLKLAEKHESVIRLTRAGQEIIRPFIAQKLSGEAKLMVIFDIPEGMAVVRARFRRTLVAWHFHQIQKSVWITSYDHKPSVRKIVSELGITDYVKLYECALI